jgi:hypothetical protein
MWATLVDWAGREHYDEGAPVSEREEFLKWYPYVVVERYSPDQTAWAQRKLESSLSWGRYVLLHMLGIGTYRLHGDWLRELFREPEDGYACDEGNICVSGGLASFTQLLLGVAQSGTVRAMTNAQTCIGVGSGATPATVADAHLGADGTTPNGTTGAYYQQCDSGYPAWAGAGTLNGGQVNGQCTFAQGNANSVWAEWCYAVGSGTITPGSTLAGVFSGGGFMVSHKVPTPSPLGTKAAGAAWVFTNSLTFS